MQTYICLLKGINIGGNNRIKMDDLKSLFTSCGLLNPRTYIQSGNIAFESIKTPNELQKLISDEILKVLDLKITSIVKSKSDWNKIIDLNPFVHLHPIEHLHLTLLKDAASLDQLNEISKHDFTPDKFQVKDTEFYICCNLKYSDTKLTNAFIEKQFKTKATTRNWKTVLAIQELLN